MICKQESYTTRWVYSVVWVQVLLLVLSSTALTTAQSINPFFDATQDPGRLSIRYFNLELFENGLSEKSGDAILVTSPDGATMLIDAGITACGAHLDEYLNRLGITKINYAVATHPHIDHIGGYLTILNTKTVEQLFMVQIPHSTSTYQNFMSLIRRRSIPYKYLQAGDSFQLGAHVQVSILHPVLKPNPEVWAKSLTVGEQNSYSMVLRIEYGNNVFLFCGDIYQNAEQEIVERYGSELLRADFMHAPHHGDAASSSLEFIQAVDPDVVVVSHHVFSPLSVYRRYRENGTLVFHTAIDGHILLTSDGNTLNVITEREERIGMASPFLSDWNIFR